MESLQKYVIDHHQKTIAEWQKSVEEVSQKLKAAVQ